MSTPCRWIRSDFRESACALFLRGTISRRDCRHAGAPHSHGTRAAYVSDRCGCTRCRAANRAAEIRRIAAISAGRSAPYTDAAPVWAHLAALRRQGVGIERIANLSGVPVGTIRRLLSHRRSTPTHSRRVRTATAQHLLAVPVTPGSGSPRRLVPARRAHQWIDDLAAAGHTLGELARQLGKTTISLRRSRSRQFITARTEASIAALHASLLATPRSRSPRTLTGARLSSAHRQSCGSVRSSFHPAQLRLRRRRCRNGSIYPGRLAR